MAKFDIINRLNTLWESGKSSTFDIELRKAWPQLCDEIRHLRDTWITEEQYLKLREEHSQLQHDRKEVAEKFAQLQAELDEMRIHVKWRSQERDAARTERDQLAARLEKAHESIGLLEEQRDSLRVRLAKAEAVCETAEGLISDTSGNLPPGPVTRAIVAWRLSKGVDP